MNSLSGEPSATSSFCPTSFAVIHQFVEGICRVNHIQVRLGTISGVTRGGQRVTSHPRQKSSERSTASFPSRERISRRRQNLPLTTTLLAIPNTHYGLFYLVPYSTLIPSVTGSCRERTYFRRLRYSPHPELGSKSATQLNCSPCYRCRLNILNGLRTATCSGAEKQSQDVLDKTYFHGMTIKDTGWIIPTEDSGTPENRNNGSTLAFTATAVCLCILGYDASTGGNPPLTCIQWGHYFIGFRPERSSLNQWRNTCCE